MAETPHASDIAAIHEVHAAWLAAELAGDPTGMLALCTDDVRWLIPQSVPRVGKAAVLEFLRAMDAQLEAIHMCDVTIEVSGNLAYKTACYVTRYRLAGDRDVRVGRGTHLWILRRCDATWRVALVT